MLVMLALACTFAGGAEAALAPRLAQRLDPRLIGATDRPEPVAVWLEFADKGESGPAGIAAGLAAAEAALSPRGRARRVRARVHPLVDYRDLPVHPPYLEELSRQGLTPMAVSRWLNRVAVRLPGTRLAGLAELPFVDQIVQVGRARVSGVEPPPPLPEHFEKATRPSHVDRGTGPPEIHAAVQYGVTLDQLEQLGIPQVHACGYDGSGVLVCLLDNGFTGHDRHEALRDQIIAPGHARDFVDGDTTVTDSASSGGRHGTTTLGCIAANRFGTYVGAAFGADFALARTERDLSETPVEMLFWGMGAEWADSLGADVISSSLGYFDFEGTASDYGYEDLDGHTTDVTRAAEIAASKGILVVNSVGNEGNTLWRHLLAPADAHGDSVIAVGAVNAFGDSVDFSSAGPTADDRIKPDLVARGRSNPVLGTSAPDAYTTSSGTSFAAPLVAGLAACLIQAHPEWSPTQVIRALRETASNASRPDNKLGYGIPNGMEALQWSPTGGPRSDASFHLAMIGPNPLGRGSAPARVSFGLDGSEAAPLPANVRVIDAHGRQVQALWSGLLCFGQTFTASWDGRRGGGRTAGPGVYWIVLQGGGHSRAVRIVSLR